YPYEGLSSNRIRGIVQLGFGQDHMGRSVCSHRYYSCVLQEHGKAGKEWVSFGGKVGSTGRLGRGGLVLARKSGTGYCLGS
nr:hypothetical protein [Tanacetum cinerariifolium]